MVRVDVAPEGVGVMVAGLKLAEAPAGTPVAFKDTGWLKPPMLVKVTV